MEQHFFEDEFEQFLRENADQHRMYPSDGVWTNIYRHLHSGRRRVALIVMLLLVFSGIIWLMKTSPVGNAPRQHGNHTKPATSIPANRSASGHSTVSVNDIIEKLRAKSLMPKVSIAAPLALAPLDLERSATGNRREAAGIDVVRTSSEIAAGVAFAPEADFEGSETATVRSTDRFDLVKDFTIEVPGTAFPLDKGPHTKLVENTPIPQAAGIVKLNNKNRNRLTYLMYFAPSIGYRNLSEGKSNYTNGNSPLMVKHLNVNQFVNHKPAVGFELGGGVRYQVSRILAFRTGLQINLTRYTIEAFAHYPEQATLALNSDLGVQDTLVATSTLRNLSGDQPSRLQNQYLQIGIPIGADLKLLGDARIQVNVSGSLQPTYLLNTDQYMLTSNLSNYVKEPSLIRKWNLASSVEAYISYQSGDVRWQIGPQFRYNLFSTYQSQYPIKENLVEYGVKIGISKSLRR